MNLAAFVLGVGMYSAAGHRRRPVHAAHGRRQLVVGHYAGGIERRIGSREQLQLGNALRPHRLPRASVAHRSGGVRLWVDEM